MLLVLLVLTLPHDPRMRRLRVLTCLALLGVGRALNVFVPVFYGRMVDRFEEVVKEIHSGDSPPGPSPHVVPHFTLGQVFLPYVLVYCILFFVQVVLHA